MKSYFSIFLKIAVVALSVFLVTHAKAEQNLLNVSYDVAREFYKNYNKAFLKHYKEKFGTSVKVKQSHGGTSTQARSVADGLPADVVTFNTTTDVDFLAKRGLVDKNWQKSFPYNASPTTSTTVFLVRKGNPKGIKDWDDLTKKGVKVVVVNPRTGGNGRLAYLAAWGYVLNKGGSDADALAFEKKLYANVPVLAKGGRAATAIFLQRNIGDVLVTFESEVISIRKEFGSNKVDAVYPSISILAENPVAIVNPVVDKKGSRALATEYIKFLYSEKGQEVAALQGIRPRNKKVLAKYSDTFRPLKLFTVSKYFGSLAKAQKVHFDDGGTFDKVYTTR